MSMDGRLHSSFPIQRSDEPTFVNEQPRGLSPRALSRSKHTLKSQLAKDLLCPAACHQQSMDDMVHAEVLMALVAQPLRRHKCQSGSVIPLLEHAPAPPGSNVRPAPR